MSKHFKKFLSYYKPYLGTFAKVMTAAMAASALSLLYPLLTRVVTRDILGGELVNVLGRIALVGGVMLLVLAVQTACESYYDYKGHVLGARMEHDIRQELFDQYLRQPLGFYDSQKTGGLLSRITSDLLNLAELYHHGPENLLVYSVRFIGAFCILAAINWKLALAAFLPLPVMAAYTVYFSRRMRASTRESNACIGDVNARVEETVSGIRVVKSFVNERLERGRFARENDRFLNSRKTIYFNESFLYQGVTALSQLISILVVVFGGVCISRGTLDAADLLTFLLYIGYLTEPVQKLMFLIEQFQQGMAGFDRFLEMMELEPDLQDAPDAVELPQVRGEVEFRHVDFRYGEQTDEVLHDVSFHAQAGATIALAGPSGVGKTTLCSLIPRFYDVCGGEILIDGVDIRRLTLDSLRRSVGVVQQETYLFSGTVVENIRYGRPDASFDEIVQAAKQAHAHDFIMALPNGYDTDIGQHGVRLSGGQRQRLSIARVFLKDPPVLVFDEATSSLDNESEAVVHASLDRLAHGRTTFIIAHRLSTIRNAERILVIGDKGIAEQGAHEELLELDGLYARLCRAGC